MEQFPLLNFFCDLQEYDRKSLGRDPLTLDEYALALDALGQGIGLFDIEDLRVVCKLLWCKPYHNPDVFDDLFENYRRKMLTHFSSAYQGAGNEGGILTGQSGVDGDQNALSKVQNKQGAKQNKNEKKKKPKPLPVSSKQATGANITEKWLVLPYINGVKTPDTSLEPIGAPPDPYETKYIIDNRQLPADLTSRRISQLLLSIRSTLKDTRKSVIDWDATIEETARRGYLIEPVRKRSLKYGSGLTLLIDCSPSMVAFEDLLQDMARSFDQYINETARVYYFNNCPVTYLYSDRNQTQGQLIADWIHEGRKKVIIISDAGAARGYTNPERLAATQKLIDLLKRHDVVWLNPMPQYRWEQTSAWYISRKIQMLECTDTGLTTAVRFMKRKN